MTTSKAGNSASIEGTLECCMCGDFGFSYELFQCKACQFRSQHRYCSNLYPKAESYRLCNWCLTQKEETKEKSQNSSNSSSSFKKEQSHQEHLHQNHDPKVNRKKKNSTKASHDHDTHGSGLRGSMKLQPSGPIKKQRSFDHHQNQVSTSPKSPSVARKRIITNGAKEEAEKIRRTISEDISNINRINNRGITRQVFRNKVRRYKLLDEVSSQ
ncbi:uncharacterized protein LOC126794583 [Argentina anserina]|uniref:uncharacterized protein LOC126794583 n=1 Tax=Argentina anserina TaxID=57926 RepID=UPI00217623E2|nr:uncharacterized protein LOC126794583 [Potentilla anserina]